MRGFFQGQRFGRHRLGQGRVGRAVGDIGTIAPFHHLDLRFGARMRAQHFQRLARSAPAAPRRRFGQLYHRAVHAHFENLGGAGQAAIFAVVQQIGTKAPDIGNDGLAGFRMQPHLARQAEQLDRPIQRQFAIGQILGYGPALGLLPLTHFDIRAKASGLACDVLPGFGMLAQHFRPGILAILAARLAEFAGIFAVGIVGTGDERPEPPAAQRQLPVAAHGAGARIAAIGLGREQHRLQKLVEFRRDVGRLLLHHLGGLGLEIAPEGFEHRLPLRPPAGDIIQLVFQPRGEVVGDVALEKPLQKGRDQPPAFLGEKPVLFHPNIVAVLEHLQGRGIGGRPPDPQLLQPLDQRCFGIARRGLGEMLFGAHFLLGRRIALAQARQQLRIIILAVVPTFLVKRQETGEDHHLPGRAQRVTATAIDHVDRRALQPSACHLARKRTLEDQVVEPRMIARAGLVATKLGRADRLMRFLRILGLGLILARLFGQVTAIIAVRDRLARSGNGAAVHLHAVGPHIGDRAILIELLRDPHRVAGRKAQLARGFLLQGRRGEGRRGIAGERLCLDLLDREAPGLHIGLGGHGVAFLADGQPVDLLALPADEPRGKALPALLHLGRDRPIFLRHEAFDLALALHHQAQRDRLHAPSRLGAGQFAPQHRRQSEAHQIVERPARPIGVDQILVQRARLGHRVQHRRLGDRVERHPVDRLGQRLLGAQHLLHMPADRLPFAVRVSGEDEAVGIFRRIGDFLEPALLVAIKFPIHREIFVRAHAAILWRQVADVAVAGENLEVLAEVFLDSFRLGRRFNDD